MNSSRDSLVDNIKTFEKNGLSSSTQSNYEIIEDMFTQKLTNYLTLGYFFQEYEPSLQAIYYALNSLDALNKLDKINKTAITNIIMSFYDDTTNLFTDQYANRYLGTDFLQCYYPYTSVLEVNCYAVLSLNIIGQLGLISSQDSIDFIWSCYNPENSENGFIGQPYDTNLPKGFKIATMDNTYYGISTLDLLLNDWSAYSSEKSRIVQYISNLQSSNGGFSNDNDTSFDSLAFVMFEPNLLSSYYCIKSLDIFNSVNSIDIVKFHQYLGDLYDNSKYSFQMCNFGLPDFANIVATSLGLELSDITGYTGTNRNEAINFILTNRNALGNWDASTFYKNHELMDTFQVIRSLKESGEIDQLTLQQKNQISNAICGLYQQYNGFSLVSKDYMSVDLINTIVTSFDLFNRISDLDAEWLYNLIGACYHNLYYCYGFVGCSNFDNFNGFRSYPIEYYNLGFRNYRDEPGFLYNHKFNYKALNSLQKIDKLDKFSSTNNLIELINDIVNSQFLDAEDENFGAFLPFFTYTLKIVECQNENIFFEYSYYAIKALELLVNHLNLGTIADLSFNKAALYGYIRRNVNETDSILYFNDKSNTNSQINLQNTYYMVYILKMLNLFDLNMQKIKQYINKNINYENIINVYYCYKISEILSLGINFNVDLTIKLVKKVFSNIEYEFYESTNHQILNQDIFLWICEMARNSEVNIECSYDKSVYLGTVSTITSAFSNLIYEEYGKFTSVRFESEQFGILELEKQYNDTYQINFMVPEDPQYYPVIDGALRIYDHSEIIGEVPIIFQTCLEQVFEYNINENEGTIKLDVNISRRVASDYQAIQNSTVKVHISRNKAYIGTFDFIHRDFSDYSKFTYIYECDADGDYYFNITLVDDFNPRGLVLFDYELQRDSSSPIDPTPPKPANVIKVNGILLAIGASIGTTIISLLVIKQGRKIKLKIYNGKFKENPNKYDSRSREKKQSDKKNTNEISFNDWD
ncbi:MAG: prenyltransferase/squalene oxidase repeat-containing protein [Promethearchaeota archaeon]